MKYKVTFTAQFTTEVDVPDGESFTDVIGDIEIPENKEVQYKSETFQVDEIIDEQGEEHFMGDDYVGGTDE